MAVALDTTFEKSAASQNSPFSYVSNAGTVAGAVGASATVLIAIFAINGSVANTGTVAVTWDQGGTNQAMTLIGSGANVGIWSIYMFGLKSPTAGAKTIQVTYTGSSATVWLGAVSFTG